MIKLTEEQARAVELNLTDLSLKKLIKDKLRKLVKKTIYLPEKKEFSYTTSVHISKIADTYREDLIKKQTESEMNFKAKLKALNILYDFQKIVYTTRNTFYIIDFYLPTFKLVIELDGGYHNELDQISKDKERTKELRSLGYNDIKRFSNEAALKINCEQLKHLLDNYIYNKDKITSEQFKKQFDEKQKAKMKATKLKKKSKFKAKLEK